MNFPVPNLLVILVFILTLSSGAFAAKPDPTHYGVAAFSDSARRELTASARFFTDSALSAHPQLNTRQKIVTIAPPRFFADKTVDFYLLMFLVLVLGLIRFTDPKYFHTIWQAFWNPVLSSRQLKDKLQTASFPNFLMNVFFTVSGAAYIYYVVENFTPQRPRGVAPSLLISMLIAGMMVIYIGKYAVVRFSGWAFRVENITEHYLFNVFLVNKIISIALLPFIILLAFAEPPLAQPALLISFIVILALFVNRYFRSWQVFGSFFQYSRFHFFTYLCASELLPLAVLMKLLVRGLLYG